MTHTYGEVGEYDVLLQFTDDRGLTSQTMSTIEVLGDSPLTFRRGGEAFVDSVLDGTQADMDPDFARSVFTFQLAAVRSAAEGREVGLDEIG